MRAAKTLVLFGVLVVGFAVLLVAFGGEPWTPVRVAGLVIAVPALVLWMVARVQLGGSFSVRPRAEALVTHGLYARIRNPLYVFGVLLYLGAILYTGHLEFLLLLAVIVPVQLVRIRREERALEAKFGDAYRRYKRRTWF